MNVVARLIRTTVGGREWLHHSSLPEERVEASENAPARLANRLRLGVEDADPCMRPLILEALSDIESVLSGPQPGALTAQSIRADLPPRFNRRVPRGR
jgi:hypothetical protein